MEVRALIVNGWIRYFPYKTCVYRWGQQLGRIDVEFEEMTGKILSYTGAPINMTQDVAQGERSFYIYIEPT